MSVGYLYIYWPDSLFIPIDCNSCSFMEKKITKFNMTAVVQRYLFNHTYTTVQFQWFISRREASRVDFATLLPVIPLV